MKNNDIQTKWTKARDEILTTPKFLKRGTLVIVDAQTQPFQMEVEGHYGKRQMYVINTCDKGLIFVSATTFVHIVDELIRHDYENTTVEI